MKSKSSQYILTFQHFLDYSLNIPEDLKYFNLKGGEVVQSFPYFVVILTILRWRRQVEEEVEFIAKKEVSTFRQFLEAVNHLYSEVGDTEQRFCVFAC